MRNNLNRYSALSAYKTRYRQQFDLWIYSILLYATFKNNHVLHTIQGFPRNNQKIKKSAKIVSFEKIIPDKYHFAGQNLFDEHKI